jgi:hypothetical protein
MGRKFSLQDNMADEYKSSLLKPESGPTWEGIGVDVRKILFISGK